MKFFPSFSTSVINKMVNEHTVNYHSSPLELTSRIHPVTFLWTPKGFISPEYFLNYFSQTVYCTIVGKTSQIHGVKEEIYSTINLY